MSDSSREMKGYFFKKSVQFYEGRHVFSLTVSKLVEQLLATPEKSRLKKKRFGSRKSVLAYPAEMCGNLLFFTGNYSLKAFN